MLVAQTIPETFRRQVERLGPRVAVRFKRHGVWVDATWNEWGERVVAAAKGLIELGVRPGDRVAILAENRFEWLIADLAVMAAAAAGVPLHASLGPEQIRQTLEDSGAVAVVCSNAGELAKIQAIADRTPTVRTTIVMDGPAETTWDALEQLGRRATSDEFEARNAALKGDDLASLIYTSGTTGKSKGVMLTHRNFLVNAAAMNEALGCLTPDAVAFNWLPFSHVYGRTVDIYVPLAAGSTIVLAQSPETVAADLMATRPMHLSSVPRFYEKLLGSMAGLPLEQRNARIRAIFGPRIRWLGCGGAALPPAIGKAYQDAGLEVIVGYGLTESSPVISTNALGHNKLGTVGRPLPGVEVKIAPDGEILTRGPCVMPGYWNQPEATAAAIKDGWLHTGDLGSLDADGYLTITGRKKDLIVLSSGKKVAPTPIESLLMASPLIEQLVIVGEGHPFLTAVVVPRDPSTNEEVLTKEIEKLLVDVAPWEHVRKIVVTTRPFTVASDEMTVSMKLRRPAIFEHYREQIEALYGERGA